VKDDRLYLIYIHECIERTYPYAEEGPEAFFSETKTQDAVLRNLQTLGESTQRLSDCLKVTYPDVDWRGIRAFRNVLAHNYLGIDMALRLPNRPPRGQ
jgi:uncharacterized protein with HEPN domain